MLSAGHPAMSPAVTGLGPRSKANAYLIAAAPELLAACETIRAHLHDLGGEEDLAHDLVRMVLDPAIAKATG